MYSAKNERNVVAVLEQAGYCSNRKLTDTLQGSIWSSLHRKSHERVIIKVTSRKLHKESMIIYDGKKYSVDENIIKEKEILKYLTTTKPQSNTKQCDETKQQRQQPHVAGVVGYRDFFKSNSNFYFVMEHGGHMLFDFVVRVHRYIESGKLSITEWHKLARIIFTKIISAVNYIHSRNVCHFDISLENILINDVEVVLDRDNKLRFCLDNIHIKLCDFGLSEQFLADNFASTKNCGKPNYKSPECSSDESFDAKANDTWCVGVCLFMLLIGGNMVQVASATDESFVQIMRGDMDKLLAKWGRARYVDTHVMDLMNKVFVAEADRPSVQQIAKHAWFTQQL